MDRKIFTASVVSLGVLAGCGPGASPFRDPALFQQRQGQTVCAAGATVPGVDVSEWQGNINWGQVAASGVAFAYVRVSDGTGHMDPTFSANWQGAKAAGLKRGAYQFFEPSESAVDQANVVVNAVGRLGNGDLPVMMDVETATPTSAELDAWLSTVEQGTGKRPIIYTSPGLWNGWFPGGGYGSYGLMVANWGASCPSMPAGWSDWVVWQQADNGSVPGIGGNVDSDVFNGSQAQLDAYTTVDLAPRGFLDAADCSGVRGWAQDQDVPDQAINVDVYFGGPAGSGAPGRRLLAADSRPDLCTAIGSCNHGFAWAAPRALMDGAAHPIHAYGIDANGSLNAELNASPLALTCAPSETGVRRHVVDPASYNAWGFDAFQDVRPVDAATFAGFPQAGAWPSTPVLVQGQGQPEVYLVDGAFKRHVQDPASAAAWHLDLSKVQMKSAAEIQALITGPDLRSRPTLIQAGPEVDVLDDPLPVVGTGTSGSTGSSGATGSTSGATGSSGSSGAAGTGSTGSTGRGSTTAGGSSGSTGASTGSTTTGGSTPSQSLAKGSTKGGGCGSASGGMEWLGLALVGSALGVGRRRAMGKAAR